MRSLSDEQLIAEYRAGIGSAPCTTFLDELFGRYYSRVSVWCYRFTGDRESAADLAQEVFTRAFRNLDSFRGDARFSTWLYTVTRNHCYNEAKARAARREEVGRDIHDVADKDAEDVVERLDRETSRNLIRRLMADCLDETEIKVMTLHYGEDVPLATISRVLQLSNASGAKAYIVSARRKLAVAVQRWKSQSARTQGA